MRCAKICPVLFPLVAGLAACSSTAATTGAQHGVPAQLVRVSGDSQSGVVGYIADNPIVLRVVDDYGTPLPGITVTFAPDPPGTSATLTVGPNGVPTSTSAISNGSGLVSTYWRLGDSLGTQHLRATVVIAPAAPNAVVELTAIANTNAVQSIDGSRAGFCAVDLIGRLGCWQPPSYARGTANTVLPVRMKLATSSVTFTAVAMKQGGGCALSTTGRPWCFTLDSTFTVTGLSPLAGTYPAFSRIAGGASGGSLCAIATDFSAWCWGDNYGGVLGDGTQRPSATPIRVPTAAQFVSLEVTDDEACGLTVDSQAWCWGDNFEDQVGIFNPVVDQITPTGPTLVNTPIRFSQLALYAYGNMACGVAADGLYCWGNVSGFGTTASATSLDTTVVPRRMRAGSLVGAAWGGSEGFFVFGPDGSVQYSVTGELCPSCHWFPWSPTASLATILNTQGSGMICGGTTPLPNAKVLCMETYTTSDGWQDDYPPIFGVPFP